jgi:hypothetical protein
VSGVETRGILEPLEGPSMVVGESYPFKLTLLPFEKRLISKETLEGSRFLDLFFVSNVESIITSENNYDAIEVYLDLVLVKKAELRGVYIWNLGDRNIPIELPNINVNDVQLNTKNFLILKTPSVEFDNRNYQMVGLLIFALLVLAALAFFFMKGKKRIDNTHKDLAGLLINAKTHQDLEEIYNRRREVLLLAKDPAVQQDIRDVISQFEKIQYAPNWKQQEVKNYVDKLSELGRELNRGV